MANNKFSVDNNIKHATGNDPKPFPINFCLNIVTEVILCIPCFT